MALLPVQVSPDFLAAIFETVQNNPNAKLTVDLPAQLIAMDGTELSEAFQINSYKKQNLLNGYDDIDYLLNIKANIEKFATQMPL